MAGLSIDNRLTVPTGLSTGGALSRGSGTFFGGFTPSPVLSFNFLNTTTLSSALTFSRPSLGMLFDSTGRYTWCPNNFLLYSNTFSDASWVKSNVSTPTSGFSDPLGGTNAWLLAPSGANPKVYQPITTPASGGNGLMTIWLKSATGSSFSLVIGSDGAGVSPNPTTTTITVTTTWQQFSLPVSWLSSAAANFSIGDGSTGWANGNNLHVFSPTYSAVTYETIARSVDQVITTSAVYYGPRFDYNPTTLASLGILLEPTRTNIALWNRDLSNAVWVKTSCTAVRDQIGIDGVSNSASSLTATGANATCLQSVTLTSSIRIMSAYVKRISGTGLIDMTTNNGTVWNSVTVTDNWTRVDITLQTLANPIFGFRVRTSGDAIAVDYVMNENGVAAATKSSAMLSTNQSVTRSEDVMTIPTISSFYNQLEGTFFFQFDSTNLVSDSTLFCVDDGTTGQANQIDVRSTGSVSTRCRVRSGGASPVDLNTGTVGIGAAVKIAFAVKANDSAAVANVNALQIGPASAAMPATTMTQIVFGRRGTTGVTMIGHWRSLQYYNTRLTNAQLQALTA
jgi:hypothetical protein